MTVTQLIRRIAAAFLFSICLVSWLALGAALHFDMPRELTVAAVFAAAFSTEAAIWGGAALLGWTTLANRGSILSRLAGRGS